LINIYYEVRNLLVVRDRFAIEVVWWNITVVVVAHCLIKLNKFNQNKLLCKLTLTFFPFLVKCIYICVYRYFNRSLYMHFFRCIKEYFLFILMQCHYLFTYYITIMIVHVHFFVYKWLKLVTWADEVKICIKS